MKKKIIGWMIYIDNEFEYLEECYLIHPTKTEAKECLDNFYDGKGQIIKVEINLSKIFPFGELRK